MTLEEAQEAKKHAHRQEAADRAGHDGARHRLRLGRHGADAGAGLRRARSGRDARRGAARDRDAARQGGGAGGPGRIPAAAITARCSGQFDRIVSVGMFEHVGVPHYRDLFPHGARPADAGRRGADPHHRPPDAAAAPPARGSASTSSPAATARRCPRSSRRSRRSSSAPPTSRSGACTTPRRCATGTTGSWRRSDEAARALRRTLLPDVALLPDRLAS